MIELKKISLQRGNKVLLEDASATIKPHTKVGFIGRNGTGKSSLFSVLKGEISIDKGDTFIPKNWLISSVSQETPSLPISALNYVLNGDARLKKLELALSQAEQEDNGEEIAHLHGAMADADAYTAPARAAKLLSGLGFSQEEHKNPVSSFSGGWRMRLNLAQALMSPSDLLLLDEPTNHLDLETVIWLEEYLKNLQSTQIIISHDKDFLNKVTTHIIELNQQRLTIYTGNYEHFEETRALQLSQQQSAYVKQQQHINHLESFIERFRYKATKAKQAQSRIKILEKLQRIAPAHLDSEFSFEFDSPEHLPNPLLKLDDVCLGYPDRNILSHVKLSIESGARLGLLGVNGSGKSTFIKGVAKLLTPTSGQIIPAEKLNIGYFAQHQLDTLRDDQSPIWHIQQLSPDVREQEIRNFLGGFNFIGEMALSAIAPFSGGEKARLALAMLVWQKPNLLLLDEPTNHLDLDMRHALTLALQTFTGALILVSHDRSLLEATTDSFLLVKDGQVSEFDGDLEDYRQLWLQSDTETKISSTNNLTNVRKENKKLEAQKRQEISNKTKELQKKLDSNEKKIANLNEEKQSIEEYLNQEDSYSNEHKDRLQQNISRLADVKILLDEIEEHWLALQSELEEVTKEIENEYSKQDIM